MNRFLPVLIAVVLCGWVAGAAPLEAASGTRLQGIRFGKHPDRLRVVLEAEGDRPSRIHPITDDGLMIEFKQLTVKEGLEKSLAKPPPPVSQVVFQEREGTFLVKILLSSVGTSVKSFVLPRNPGYRLAFDLTGGTPAQKEDKGTEAATKAAATAGSPDKATNPRKGHFSPKIPEPASSHRTAVSVPEFPPNKETKDPAFREADELFLSSQENLAEKAEGIIDLYTRAIKASPASSHIPLALYRSGLTYLAMKDPKKAQECFKKVITDFPGDAMVPQCWLSLGQIHQQGQSYVESVHALRTALRHPMEKQKMLDAHYALGRVLAGIDAHQEALENLTKCLSEDGEYYLKRPDILRSLGESYFAVQDYEKSTQYLFWYLNLEKELPDRDWILAKIAEGLLYQRQFELANQVYSYIEKYHAGSEGHTIGMIRKAEFLEQQEEGLRREALEIYKDLALKSLSPSLYKLVMYKLAASEWKEGNYERSLILLDETLRFKAGPGPEEKLLALRAQVLTDWVKKAHSEKDFARVVELDRQNPYTFLNSDSPDVLARIADSYCSLRLYPKALELYEHLLQRSGNKNQEWIYKTAYVSYLMGETEKSLQILGRVQAESLECRKLELQGRIFFARKQYREANQTLGKILQNEKVCGPMDPEVGILYAESLMRLEKYGDALSWLPKICKLPGADPPAIRIKAGLLQGKCHQALKQPQQAIEILEELVPLLDSESQMDQVNYQLSALYLEVGQPAKAKEKLTRLLESKQELWKAAAQQQLGYIQMKSSGSKTVSF
ncbi:MAG TPA: tetratricopeptide repeat protein [Syntrophobacteraceae bacterium]|nr:tetratricopeptide repeat protein [Syntrophobacteraceae bacterium]